jgi:RNA polymerase primary sigma factor
MKKNEMFKAIHDLGTRRGTLTYDEINDAFSPEYFSLDELERLLDRLESRGVKVIDYRNCVN